MDKIKVGVIGVGHLGQHHARIYAGMEGVELCVQSTNSAAKAFYDHLDYRFVSRERSNLMMRKEIGPVGGCAEEAVASPDPV